MGTASLLTNHHPIGIRLEIKATTFPSNSPKKTKSLHDRISHTTTGATGASVGMTIRCSLWTLSRVDAILSRCWSWLLHRGDRAPATCPSSGTRRGRTVLSRSPILRLHCRLAVTVMVHYCCRIPGSSSGQLLLVLVTVSVIGGYAVCNG